MLKMVKKMIILSGLAVLLLAAGGAAADSTIYISDTTWMRPWTAGAPTIGGTWGDWTDTPIANADEQLSWQINRVSVSWSAGGQLQSMMIYTNYPQAGLDAAVQADIALDRNHDGVFETGIKMNGTDLGKICTVSSWKNPNNFWSVGGYTYTGQYAPLNDRNEADARVPNTVIDVGSNNLGMAEVTWTPGSDTAWVINIIFPQAFDAGNNWNSFDFTVGSGSCANEFMAGTAINPQTGLTGNAAPIPASFVLLATGILALAVLSRRKKVVLVRGDGKEGC